MGLAALALFAVALECGWLALWPLSGALSHSPLFNAAFLADHPLAARAFETSLHIAQRVLPGLAATPLTDPLGAPVYQAPAWALVGVFAWLCLTYLGALFVLGRVRSASLALAIVLIGAAGFQATLQWLPGLYSQDVFSYVAYGQLSVKHGLNPYIWPPSAVPRNDLLPWVAEIWRSYPAPYGPFWLDVQSAMARLTGDWSFADQALAYRGLGNGLLLIDLGLVWYLLGRLTPLGRSERVLALAAVAWHPLVLFEVAANAHNDVLMVTASLVGLVVLTRSGSGVLGACGFTLGALVKYLSGIGVVWTAIAAAARGGSPGRRLVRVALVGGAAAALVVVVALPWLELPDSLEPLLAETASVGYVNSLPDVLDVALADQVVRPLAHVAPETARETTRAVSRVIVLGVFAAYLLWEGRRVWRGADAAAVAAATARACLVYVLLVSTSVQTWYFCLPVTVSLALGWRTRLAQVSVSYALLALPALYLSYYLRASTPQVVFVAYGLLPLVPLVLAWRSGARARAHVPAAVHVGDDKERTDGHSVAGAVMEQAGR